MSEVEQQSEVEVEVIDQGVQGEVGTVTGDEVDLERNDINDFLDAIQNKDFTKANGQFDDMISDRLQAQLDQAKAKIAGQLYNQEPAEEEEPVEN